MLNYKPLQIISLSIITAALMLGCSSDDGDASSAQTQPAGSIVGYLVDSPIEGLHYTCGTHSGTTGSGGQFACEVFPVVFKIGNYTVGTLSQMPTDDNVYPQDLLGLDRNNTTNVDLVDLVQFLQALDDDGDITTAIVITPERHAEFENIRNDQGGGTVPDGVSNPRDAGTSAGLRLPNPVTAMDHLRKSISPTDYQRADTQDISPYMGTWIGEGGGWEVRFKHSSGDFVSSFVGIDRDELPFSGEKTIMSLTVTHSTSFKFTVDGNGDVQGDGVIVYDVLPNLCGLNALTSELVNGAVGSFDKIFALSGMVGANGIGAGIENGATFSAKTISLVKEIRENSSALYGFDLVSLLTSKVQAANLKNQNVNEICKAVRLDSHVRGGLTVGPVSLDEVLKNGGMNVLKAITGASSVAGGAGAIMSIILSVPGVTQVQYQYKGLEHGPETRHYSLSGHINDSGEMQLSMDAITQGSDDLTIEYTVNWQTDRPTFPTWSPFLEDSGIVYPGNRDVTVYKYVTKSTSKSYTDYSNTSAPTVKSIDVEEPVLEASTVHLTMPMASFKDAGTKRNGVSVWHEYEYGWNAYKVID